MAPGAVAVGTDSPTLLQAVSPRIPSPQIISDDAVSAIVEAGLRAPSGDNCQPWRFRWDGAHVRVVLVPERADSFYDVAHAASWISLGAVLTNMTLAARDRGFRLAVELFPADDSPQVVARGRLEPCAVCRDPLTAVIPARCVNRKPYRKNPLPGAVRDELHALGSMVPGVRLSLIETEPAKSRLAALAAQNDRFLFQHRGLHQGLYRWIRWTPDEIARSRDGMPVEALELARSERPGIRLLKSWSLTRILSVLGGGRLFSSRARRIYSHSGALALLTVDGARPEDFVRGGEVLERIWLTATARGIALQPITGITLLLLRLSLAHGQGLSPRHRNVLERLEREFYRVVPAAGGDVPVMLFRLGLAAPPSARATRLAIETVLIVDKPHAGEMAPI